jgi:hypothetical protein
MQSGHPKPLPGEAADAVRTAGYARKQRWKKRPGNRYTAQELRRMSQSLGPFRIVESEFHVMRLD